MNFNSARRLRVPSLLLAAALQVMPLVRAALPAAEAATKVIAIVFRWTAAAAAALGGVNAVSGASTTITNPLNVNATNGQPFSLRLTTAPDQAHYWKASGLPTGLSVVGTNGLTAWWILGTPTVSGTFNVALTAKDQVNSDPSLTVTATLIINVLGTGGPTPPVINTQPLSQTATQGQNVTFTVSATGSAPLSYQWRFQGAAVPGQTNSALTLNSITTANAGSYDVIVRNGAGSVTSSAATLTVLLPAVAPTITSQPASLTVTQGQSATFSISATGTAPLTCFWRKDSTVLKISTNLSFTIANAQPADAGAYSVTVSNTAGTAVSSSASLMVISAPQAPFIAAAPTNCAVVAGSPATFTAVAGGSTPLQFQWYFNNAPLPGQISPSCTIASVQSADVGSYFVVVTNSFGSVTSAAATLSLITPPQITLSPRSQTNLVGSNATFTVSVASTVPPGFQWRKNGANLSDGGRVSGTRSSSITITALQTNDAGNYTVVVTNAAGAVTSSVAVLTVTLPPVVLAPITVRINGRGTVTPNLNGQLLEIDKAYTMTASPSADHAFVNWTGGVLTNSPSLTFVMRSNLMVQANFVSTLVTFINGNYSGLFYESAAVSHASSGSIVATTTSKGTYTAKLLLAGRRYSFSGQFTRSGRATNSIARSGQTTVIVELQLDATDHDQLHGRVTDGSWSADLEADRAVYDRTVNPAPQAGSYTLVIPGTPNATDVPAGDGYGTITVNAAGVLKFKGALADGTKVAQSVTISKRGEWPLYVSFFSGQGAILSWQCFTNRSSDDLNGRLSWIRGPQPSAAYYPMGFGVETEAFGSKYFAPESVADVLDLGNDPLRLTGGNLPQPLAEPTTPVANNRITGPNNLVLSLTLKSGLFKGSFLDPATGKRNTLSGVLLLKQNAGRGFFLGPTQSGCVYIGP